MRASARKRAISRADASRVVEVPSPSRVEAIDALRGLAIVAMIAYHFAFDLRYFGVTRSDFENDSFWLTTRGAIVTSFLLLVGISAVLADRAGCDARHFMRRVAVIAACALAVSLASHVLFPQTFIYFGILHCIAVSLLIARPLARHPRWAIAIGIVVILAGLTLSHPAFDSRATSWIGFNTRKPATQDFVPLFPWLGVVLLGVGAGHALAANRFRLVAPLGNVPRLMRAMGRHSLAIYMVHQPLLLGAMWLALRLAR